MALLTCTLVAPTWSAAQQGSWQAAWMAPHSDAFASIAARDQTPRQVIATHATGTVARLRLSNRFGMQAVQVWAASIGAALPVSQGLCCR